MVEHTIRAIYGHASGIGVITSRFVAIIVAMGRVSRTICSGRSGKVVRISAGIICGGMSIVSVVINKVVVKSCSMRALVLGTSFGRVSRDSSRMQVVSALGEVVQLGWIRYNA